MSKEQLQTNNIELGGNNDELDGIYNTLDSSLVSLANDTVTAETLAEGETAHDANGNEVVGVMPTSAVLYTEQTLSNDQKEQARTNIGAASAENLAALFQNLLTGGEISVVKSRQQGKIAYGTTSTGYTSFTIASGWPRAFYIDVTLAAVDTSKCIVDVTSGAGSEYLAFELVSSTALRIYIYGGYTSSTSGKTQAAISWQVVELY